MCRHGIRRQLSRLYRQPADQPNLKLPAVSGAEEIHLRFWQWFAYYPYGRYDSYDYGTVQISTDAGRHGPA